MDGAVDMLWRTVDRVELERARSGGGDVVPGALRHDHGIVVLHRMIDAVDRDHTFASFDAEELVAVVMHFRPDLLARVQRHHHQLQVMPGVEDAAEVAVVLRDAFDVVDITLHGARSPYMRDRKSVV